MSHEYLRRSSHRAITAALTLWIALSACAQTGGVSADAWKEEVLLHDGQKIIVERSQTYGGRREIGQGQPIRELRLSFTPPGASRPISWKSEYGEELGRTNFKLLALHILNGTPYLVTVPNLCLAYNKWGRPNPPYVIFKYSDANWNRIELRDLPAQFQKNNLMINTLGEKTAITANPLVKADLVESLNRELEQPEYRSILREAVNYDPDCIEMVSNGKGLWRAAAWFGRTPDVAACEIKCQDEKFDDKHCPCKKIFQRSQK